MLRQRMSREHNSLQLLQRRRTPKASGEYRPLDRPISTADISESPYSDRMKWRILSPDLRFTQLPKMRVARFEPGEGAPRGRCSNRGPIRHRWDRSLRMPGQSRLVFVRSLSRRCVISNIRPMSRRGHMYICPLSCSVWNQIALRHNLYQQLIQYDSGGDS